MGYGSALVDRARIVRQRVVTQQRVEGSSVIAPVEGAWFRARLEVPAGSESDAPSGGRTRQVRVPTLMYEDVDEDGQLVDLSGDDRVEVDSEELGRTNWQVTAPPQPIRKKRSVIGYQVQVRRIGNRELART